LARAFGLQTIAEGIETEVHYKALPDKGCEFGQGYYIARPMPANELPNGGCHKTFNFQESHLG
jgi:EAL domain-containing protein (putative c-di-GMP-specific phosphodiesterase class I)